MPVDWEKYQDEAREATEKARAAVISEVDEVRNFYRKEFEKAQTSALQERDSDVGLGETPEAFQARIAAVPGIFNDRAQSAAEIVHAPHIEASIAAQKIATSHTVEPTNKEPAESTEDTSPEPEAETPAENQEPAPEPTPEATPEENATPEPSPEPQPEQPTPEPEQESVPEPSSEPVADAPQEEQAPAAEDAPAA